MDLPRFNRSQLRESIFDLHPDWKIDNRTVQDSPGPELLFRFQKQLLADFPYPGDLSDLDRLDHYEELAEQQSLPHVFQELRGLFYCLLVNPERFPGLRNKVQEYFEQQYHNWAFDYDGLSRIIPKVEEEKIVYESSSSEES